MKQRYIRPAAELSDDTVVVVRGGSVDELVQTSPLVRFETKGSIAWSAAITAQWTRCAIGTSDAEIVPEVETIQTQKQNWNGSAPEVRDPLLVPALSALRDAGIETRWRDGG